MTASIAFLACPLCGAAGSTTLFFVILGMFILMFSGTILLFLAAMGRGEWRNGDLRWSAVRAEGITPEQCFPELAQLERSGEPAPDNKQ